MASKTRHESVKECIEALRCEFQSLRERLKTAEANLLKALPDRRE